MKLAYKMVSAMAAAIEKKERKTKNEWQKSQVGNRQMLSYCDQQIPCKFYNKTTKINLIYYTASLYIMTLA